jgi:hypothetical protein
VIGSLGDRILNVICTLHSEKALTYLDQQIVCSLQEVHPAQQIFVLFRSIRASAFVRVIIDTPQ